MPLQCCDLGIIHLFQYLCKDKQSLQWQTSCQRRNVPSECPIFTPPQRSRSFVFGMPCGTKVFVIELTSNFSLVPQTSSYQNFTQLFLFTVASGMATRAASTTLFPRPIPTSGQRRSPGIRNETRKSGGSWRQRVGMSSSSGSAN